MTSKKKGTNPLDLLQRSLEDQEKKGENQSGEQPGSSGDEGTSPKEEKLNPGVEKTPPSGNSSDEKPEQEKTKSRRSKKKLGIEQMVERYDNSEELKTSAYLYKKDRDLLKSLAGQLGTNITDLNAAILDYVLRDLNVEEAKELLSRSSNALL